MSVRADPVPARLAGGIGRRRRDAFAAGLAPLGRRSAFSWPVAAIYLVLTSVKQLLSDAPAIGGGIDRWILGVAISAVLFLATFAVARRTIGRVAEPEPAVVIAAYLALSVARAVTVAIVGIAVGVTDDLLVDYRLASLVGNLGTLSVIGFTVGRAAMHREIIGELERHRRRVLETERRLGTRLEQARAELAVAVRASLEPAMRELDAALAHAAAGSEPSAALARLEAFIERQVRPVSHRLAAEGPELDAPDAPHGADVVPRVPLPARYRVADGIRPGLTTTVGALVLFATAVRDLAHAAVVAYAAVSLGVVWTCLTLLRGALGARTLPTPAAVAITVAGHGLAAGIALEAVLLAGLGRPAAIVLPGIIGIGILGGIVAFGEIVEARRAAAEGERALMVASLEDAVARLGRRNRVVRLQLARVLHGGVQGGLYAASMRLRSRPAPTAAVVAEVRDAVAAALDQLDAGDPGAGRTRAYLDAVALTWEGLRSITARIDAGADTVLAADVVADEAVAEVVREAVNNALRHGGAQQVAVELAPIALGANATRSGPDGGRGIEIRVIDDGSGWAPDAGTGQGSALFDELCRSWSHASDADGTVFRGVVPLG
ncbi:MAG: hypothetical protein RL338_601 [Chloroflexota bacterium]